MKRLCSTKRADGHHLTWRDAIRILRNEVAPGLPVVVRRRLLTGYMGLCTKHDSKYIITIDSRLGQDCAIWAIIHEWAHALSFAPPPPDTYDHGPEYGVAYSRVYQSIYGP